MAAVVQSPEDAASQQAAFDYVLLCVKALPEIYSLSDIISSVVTPQHTCILVNTTNTLGVEKELQERFPTNVVLSLVSGADLTQLGSSEFEHRRIYRSLGRASKQELRHSRIHPKGHVRSAGHDLDYRPGRLQGLSQYQATAV